MNDTPTQYAHTAEPLIWSDDFNTGNALLDAVHADMVQQLAHLAQLADDYAADNTSLSALRRALLGVVEHTREHFDLEEQWMARLNFPAAGCHINEHKQVYGVMVQVLAALDEGQTQYVGSLARELGQWLAIHIETMDYALTHFISSTGAQVGDVAQANSF